MDYTLILSAAMSAAIVAAAAVTYVSEADSDMRNR